MPANTKQIVNWLRFLVYGTGGLQSYLYPDTLRKISIAPIETPGRRSFSGFGFPSQLMEINFFVVCHKDIILLAGLAIWMWKFVTY